MKSVRAPSTSSAVVLPPVSGGSERCTMRAGGARPARASTLRLRSATATSPLKLGEEGSTTVSAGERPALYVGVEARRDHETDVDLLLLHLLLEPGGVGHRDEGQAHGATGLLGKDRRELRWLTRDDAHLDLLCPDVLVREDEGVEQSQQQRHDDRREHPAVAQRIAHVLAVDGADAAPAHSGLPATFTNTSSRVPSWECTVRTLPSAIQRSRRAASSGSSSRRRSSSREASSTTAVRSP